MKPSTANSGDEIWISLGHDTQFAIVKRLVSSRSKELKKRFPDVISLGFGYKTVNCGRLSEAIVCVGFLVKKKKTDDSKSHIPKFLVAYVEIDGRKRRCHVPTDVEELGHDCGPQGLLNVATGVTAASPSIQDKIEVGAVCCVVQKVGDSNVNFLLSCTHLFGMAEASPTCQSYSDTTITDSATSTVVGRLFEANPLIAGGRVCIDAALATIDCDDAVECSYVPAPWPNNIAPNEPTASTNCTIYTPRGALSATYVKTWLTPVMDYDCGQITISSAYQFYADTIQGDSGSPVMDDQGNLFGMHFYGSTDASTGRNCAYAIPASNIFSAGIFSVAIQLP